MNRSIIEVYSSITQSDEPHCCLMLPCVIYCCIELPTVAEYNIAYTVAFFLLTVALCCLMLPYCSLLLYCCLVLLNVVFK